MVFKLSDLAVGLSEFQDYFHMNNNNKNGFIIDVKNITKKFKKVRIYMLLNLLLLILGIIFFGIYYGPEIGLRLNISPGSDGFG